MAVQFYLFPRPLKSGENPISMSVYVSNTRLQTTIGISVNPNYWMDARQKVKKGAVNSKGMKSAEINEKLESIDRAFREFEVANNGAPVDKNKMKEVLSKALYGEAGRTKKDSIDFYTLLQNIIDSV